MAFSLVRLPNNAFALRPWDSTVVPSPQVRITDAGGGVLYEGQAKPQPMRLAVAINDPMPVLEILES